MTTVDSHLGSNRQHRLLSSISYTPRYRPYGDRSTSPSTTPRPTLPSRSAKTSCARSAAAEAAICCAPILPKAALPLSSNTTSSSSPSKKPSKPQSRPYHPTHFHQQQGPIEAHIPIASGLLFICHAAAPPAR